MIAGSHSTVALATIAPSSGKVRLPLRFGGESPPLLGEVGAEIERPAFEIPVLGAAFGLPLDDAGDTAAGGRSTLDVGFTLGPVALDVLDLDAAFVLRVELVDQL